jgi:hypothetical protein
MTPDILSLIYQVFKDFGAGAVEFGIIIFLLWKLANNHLRHISSDIKTIGTDVKAVQVELKENTRTTNELGQRVAKIEGKLSAHIGEKNREL